MNEKNTMTKTKNDKELRKMKASEISIQVSPITNTIYAGKITNSGNYPVWSQKKDVTDEVLSATAQYMDTEYREIEFAAGTLIWKPKEEPTPKSQAKEK